MNWLEQRQDIVAQNVANVNTPGYRSHDVIPFEKHLGRTGEAGRHQPVATDVRHFAEGHARPRRIGTEENRTGIEAKPTGNQVSLEHELMKVAENATQHELALNVYGKQADMIRAALGQSG